MKNTRISVNKIHHYYTTICLYLATEHTHSVTNSRKIFGFCRVEYVTTNLLFLKETKFQIKAQSDTAEKKNR